MKIINNVFQLKYYLVFSHKVTCFKYTASIICYCYERKIRWMNLVHVKIRTPFEFFYCKIILILLTAFKLLLVPFSLAAEGRSEVQ